MKFIVVPLAFLVVFALISMMGVGSALEGTQYVYISGNPANGWYDANDHLVAYANRTAAGEAGKIIFLQTSSQGPWNYLMRWNNQSVGGSEYPVYDSTGANMIAKEETQFNVLTTDGLISIIAVAVIGGGIGVTAITLLGGSDVGASAILKGTLYFTIWSIFSLLAYGLIAQIPALMGGIFWFALTIIYTLGVVNQIGSPGSED